MYLVSHLLSFVSEYSILFTFQIALHEVGQESVQFNSGVVGPRQAAASEAAGRHIKVAPVFLHHDVGGDLGGPIPCT